MNILLLTNAIAQPDDIDKGINDLVFSFARSWKELGHNIIIVNNESCFPLVYYKLPKFLINFFKARSNFTVPSISSRSYLEFSRDNIDIVRMPIKKVFPHSSFSKKKYKNQEKKIIDYLDKKNFIPDIVVGHWLEPQIVLINELGFLYNAKKALVMHSELNLKIIRKYLNQFNALDVLFFRSFPTTKKMIELFGDKIKCEIETCYSGIPDSYANNDLSKKSWKENDVLHFIFVGRLVKYKKLDVLIKALAQTFSKDKYVLKIIGDGPEKQNIEELIRTLRLNDSIFMLGRMNRDLVVREMNSSDCFVMVSENEVFGLVYLEAMACGCITVASLNGGVDGIILNGINGFLSVQGSVDSLKTVLKEINELDNVTIGKIRNCAKNTIKGYTDTEAAKHYLNCIIKEKER